MAIKQAILLCGGAGTRLNDNARYQPIVETPKPLIEVGGKPFLSYSINMLKGIGVEDIVLLVGYMKEWFEPIASSIVRLVGTREDVNQAVLGIPKLHSLFLLLNGDCFPLMDWRDFINTDMPRVAVKIVDRDAGVAIVAREDIIQKKVSCDIISAMTKVVPNYTILGGLHIGTVQGLHRARQFMDIAVFGQ